MAIDRRVARSPATPTRPAPARAGADPRAARRLGTRSTVRPSRPRSCSPRSPSRPRRTATSAAPSRSPPQAGSSQPRRRAPPAEAAASPRTAARAHYERCHAQAPAPTGTHASPPHRHQLDPALRAATCVAIDQRRNVAARAPRRPDRTRRPPATVGATKQAAPARPHPELQRQSRVWSTSPIEEPNLALHLMIERLEQRIYESAALTAELPARVEHYSMDLRHRARSRVSRANARRPRRTARR
jgi:hypothetical protein